MTDVIVGEKKVGRPIRFEHRRFEPAVAKLVFVGVNQIGIGMTSAKPSQFERAHPARGHRRDQET